ncbi:hypothetical protein OROGR_026283 [Orobanche gracilis]
MARGPNTLALLSTFVLLLFLLSNPDIVDARLIRTSSLEHENKNDSREITKVLDYLHLEAIKSGGPSDGGDGHATRNASTMGLEGIKKSGPSPGDGN